MLKYESTHRLLFIVSDGMVHGAGNDRSTPQILLEILGAGTDIEPTAKAYYSVSEGRAKCMNYAKIYAGWYQTAETIIPYVVIVKVGLPQELLKPGNRGKRDSQMILMRFLSKVLYEDPMTPLELEIYHQMKSVLGVDPNNYEYLFMVDADTKVLPESLNRMISCCVHDLNVIGICGETRLANEKRTWVTMIQVYEYYISHHISKAFESLFGTVTCLPGCFCLYRLKYSKNGKITPLLLNKKLLDDYAETNVDTLHKKNLLSLGEDRYLTTLTLKYFPDFRTKFTPDAVCLTAAPEKWSILLSQRRRWINSTIHNLFELLLLPDMCGFCCLSMRFVVLMDLYGTLVMPASLVYLAYLIHGATSSKIIPTISILLLAAVYGMQVMIFLLKRQWQHIGWMVIHILSLPLFGFYIPLYAYWHFDDFSWGNTRRVKDDHGTDLTSEECDGEELYEVITMKTWNEYCTDQWGTVTQVSL